MGSRFIIMRGRNILRSARLLAAAFVILSVVNMAAPASAAINYNAEIKRLEAEKSSNASSRAALEDTALTLEQKISNLQTTITSLDAQIRTNQASQADLTAKILQTTRQIQEEQAALGKLIRQMYIDNDISMLEKMASSKNMSDYVEKEEYARSMQTQIKQTIDRINALKKQQESQKVLVDKLVADNKAMQVQVTAEKQEVTTLLAMNQQQQSAYTQSITTASTQINSLEREQAEENLRFQREQAALAEAARRKAAANPPAATGNNSAAAQQAPQAATPSSSGRAVNGRAYPYANAPFPNETSDSWGMYQRQCVSYTAWAVATSGRHMPYWGGRGNAKQWDDNARAAGIPVDRNPRSGDVAVSNRGTYGHVMYVESVNGDGSINISQYNAAWDGRYSEARIFPGDLVFIHF
ncbi:MAG TPA: CHAP domain-containing protein [Candidatus Saccharimonadales bacterium]|jgi:surface antigen